MEQHHQPSVEKIQESTVRNCLWGNLWFSQTPKFLATSIKKALLFWVFLLFRIFIKWKSSVAAKLSTVLDFSNYHSSVFQDWFMSFKPGKKVMVKNFLEDDKRSADCQHMETSYRLNWHCYNIFQCMWMPASLAMTWQCNWPQTDPKCGPLLFPNMNVTTKTWHLLGALSITGDPTRV